MSIIRTQKKKKNFTLIHNEVLQDSRLSFEARGILCYLLSKPDNWICRVEDLKREGGIGRDKVKRIFKELQKNGYAKLEANREKSGKVKGRSWVIYEDPNDENNRTTENPSFGSPKNVKTDRRENRPSEKPTVGKHVDIVNTDLVQSTDKEIMNERESERAHAQDFESSNSSLNPPASQKESSGDQCLNIESKVREKLEQYEEENGHSIKNKVPRSVNLNDFYDYAITCYMSTHLDKLTDSQAQRKARTLSSRAVGNWVKKQMISGWILDDLKPKKQADEKSILERKQEFKRRAYEIYQGNSTT